MGELLKGRISASQLTVKEIRQIPGNAKKLWI
jgi:hypothetical protein